MRAVRRYTLLAFGITWLAVLPLVLRGLGLIRLEISPLWHVFGAFGPVTAAFILRRSADPSFRVRDLYKRQAPIGRRVTETAGATGTVGPGPAAGRAWTVAFLLTPLLFLGIAWIVAAVSGAPIDTAAVRQSATSPAWLANLVVASVFYGFGEEPGWRGWLLPHLQEKRGAVRSTLMLSVIWAAWHAPFFTYRYNFGAGTITFFFIGLVAGAFWLTFLFNSTAGSVMAVVTWHVLWNVTNMIAAVASPLVVAVLNALAMVLGFGVAAAFGRRNLTLRTRRSPGVVPVTSERGVITGRG